MKNAMRDIFRLAADVITDPCRGGKRHDGQALRVILFTPGSHATIACRDCGRRFRVPVSAIAGTDAEPYRPTGLETKRRQT